MPAKIDLEGGGLRGKVCMVTGASSGIGRETARGLARLGAAVVLVCRDPARGREALEEIRRETGNDDHHLIIADLSSQAQVRNVPAELAARHDRLHVLVNNAAVITRERAVTADGIETQLAVNHLAGFLLTHLCLDLLKTSAPARVVNVASQVESAGRIDFDDLGRERGYDPTAAYAQSKLANVLFTYELARRLQGTGITANCLHPGVIATKLLDDYIGRPRALNFLNRLRNPGAREGARTSIHLASSPTVAGLSGRYFIDSRPARSSPASYDLELAKRLWEVSAGLTGIVGEDR